MQQVFYFSFIYYFLSLGTFCPTFLNEGASSVAAFHLVTKRSENAEGRSLMSSSVQGKRKVVPLLQVLVDSVVEVSTVANSVRSSHLIRSSNITGGVIRSRVSILFIKLLSEGTLICRFIFCLFLKRTPIITGCP